MQSLMKAGFPSRNNSGEEVFIPDFSEGTEVGVYLALLELIDEGLLITGDEYILDANSAACRLLGRSYRQLAGRPLADLFPDGYAFIEARERLLIRGEGRGTLRFALPDGRACDFPYIAAPRLRPGLHALVFGHHAAVTAAAAAEAVSVPVPQASRGWPLALHFRPQLNVRSGRLHAGEALLRRHPPGQNPSALDPLSASSAVVESAGEAAEEANEAELDAWALSVVCRAATTWPQAPGHVPMVSINISAGQIPGGGLPKLVRAALSASHLDPRNLELSIDARALSLPEADIAPVLRTLSEMRVRLALDGFGHDPAPLAHLSRYHFGLLKLDPTFAAGVGHDDESTARIESIIRMSAPLGIQVMARGVRSKAQQDFLLALGCELQQGPFIGTAQDEHMFVNFLSERLFC